MEMRMNGAWVEVFVSLLQSSESIISFCSNSFFPTDDLPKSVASV